MNIDMLVDDSRGISASIDSAADPLLANVTFAYTQAFRVLGVSVEVSTNAAELLTTLAKSWSSCAPCNARPLTLRIGVTPGSATLALAAPVVRGDDHQLSIIADAGNFIICNLERGSAFGWITQAVLRQACYLQYSLLDAAVKCLISTSLATPIHAACVSYLERGFLLCGDSGAGKTTLAYACARAGWTYTSDDASYLLWQRSTPVVRGNADLIRFRPSAKTLFPELGSREVTKRAEGKPSIEVLTGELGIQSSPEAEIRFIIFLEQRKVPGVALERLTAQHGETYFSHSLFASGVIRNRQAEALSKLKDLETFRMTYSELSEAISSLALLAGKY